MNTNNRETNVKLWAISIQAAKYRITDIIMPHQAWYSNLDTKEQVREWALSEAMRIWSESDGYFNHHVSVVEIPLDDLVEFKVMLGDRQIG